MNASLRGRLEAWVLLGIGAGTLWFAVAGDYARLMNPSFRSLTIAGAALVATMGVALLRYPRRHARGGALFVFTLLLAVVAVGRPFSPGVTPPFASAATRPTATVREGYDPLEVRTLFEGLREEADVIPGTYVLPGVVYRTPALDALDTFLLVDPLMACCIADAVGFCVRVTSAEPLPEAETWVYVYGTLERVAVPVVTPRFRMGAIVFTTISQRYTIEADEIVTFHSLLADVVEQIPADRCALFRRALETTGLAETLRGEGPFTVFAPLDLVFERLPEAERTALFSPAGRARLRALLEDFVVRGVYSKRDLLELDELETISGRRLRVTATNAAPRIEGARVLFGDSTARNGMLHIVHPGWLDR